MSLRWNDCIFSALAPSPSLPTTHSACILTAAKLRRAQILKDRENYGARLLGIEGLPEKVYSKQLLALERLFKGLLQTT